MRRRNPLCSSIADREGGVQFIGYLLIGLAAGLLGGLMGVGGGVIAVPALVLFYGFKQQGAQAASLAMIAPTALVGAYTYWRHGDLDLRAAGLVAIGAVSAAWLGATVATRMDPTNLRRLFSLFIIGMGIYLFWSTVRK